MAASIEGQTMTEEIQLINDGNGLAIIGGSSAVERFLAFEGLDVAETTNLPMPRLSNLLNSGSQGANFTSDVAAASGRWMKLTEESAKIAHKYPLVKSKETGASYGTARAKDSNQFVANLQFENGIMASASNPLVLSGIGGLMAQQAMQQAMNEIAEYLAVIDVKLDDVLRAQNDAVIADMIGIEFAIAEAMTIREKVGRVSEVTWSKLQASSTTIGRTQAYALRRLDALAEKLEDHSNFTDLTEAARDAEKKTNEWLAVLAHCVKLQESLAILELDRVLEVAPEELDDHRWGLITARTNRRDAIERTTENLLDRISTAAGTANAKVLFNPIQAPSIVRASNHVTSEVVEFQNSLGIESARSHAESRAWIEAAVETRDNLLEKGADGIDVAKRFGGEAKGRAKLVSSKIADRRQAWSRSNDDDIESHEFED